MIGAPATLRVATGLPGHAWRANVHWPFPDTSVPEELGGPQAQCMTSLMSAAPTDDGVVGARRLSMHAYRTKPPNVVRTPTRRMVPTKGIGGRQIIHTRRNG